MTAACGWLGARQARAGTDVVANGGVFFVLVGNVENVGNRRHSASAWTSRSPGLRLPCGDRAVFLRAHFHASVSRRPRARDLQFRVALQHDAYRASAGFSGKSGSSDVPAISGKLAAKAAADVVLMNPNIGGGNSQRFRHLRGDAGDVLRGNVREQMVFVGPLGDGTVRLEAAVNDHRSPVKTFRDDLGFRERFVGFALSLSGSLSDSWNGQPLLTS